MKKLCQKCNYVYDGETYHNCERGIHPTKDIQAAFKRSVEAEREIEKLRQENQILREQVQLLENSNRVMLHTHRFPAPDYIPDE